MSNSLKEARESPTTSFERILLCRTDHLGDVILALPCALLLKRLYPKCRLSFLTSSYTASVVRLLSCIDEVIEIDRAARLADEIKSRRFGAAVALYPEFRLAKALRRAKVPLRIGTAYRWYSFLFNARHKEHRKHNLKHELEYNLSLTFSACGARGRWQDYLPPENIFPLALNLPDESVRRATVLLDELGRGYEKIIAIHPGGSGSAHRWPLESFCELARRLAFNSKIGIIVTGVEKESHLCEAVSRAAGSKAQNLCGKLSLLELAGILKKVNLLVANSTGPLHLGRALGTSVLGLFPSDPAMSPVRWGPYNQPDNVLIPPPEQPMSNLTVETVLSRVQDLLGGRP